MLIKVVYVLLSFGMYMYQFLSYCSSITKVRSIVQDLGNQAQVKFCDVVRTLIVHSSLLLDYLITGVYNCTLRFLEIFHQVYNYGTQIGVSFIRDILQFVTLLDVHFPGGIPILIFFIITVIKLALALRQVRRLVSFIRNILQFVTLLDVHFPGGIPVIAILIFFIITVIKLALALQQVRRLSEAYSRCMDDKQKLQLKLEEVTLMLHKEAEKLKKESDKNLKLRSNLEDEKDKRLCGICQERVKKIVLLPCQHMCLCKQCLEHEEWKRCPICRQGVESNMEIYV